MNLKTSPRSDTKNFSGMALWSYALGGNGRDGIAIISGDAGGFQYLDGEPLNPDDVQSTIHAYLDNDDTYDILDRKHLSLLRKQADNEDLIEAIHAVHLEWYGSYREGR